MEKEFYSTTPSKRMSTLKAIEHSLKKWKGLTKANLKKHNIIHNDNSYILIDTNESFYIMDDTCSLCIKFRSIYFSTQINHECKKCPLYKINNKACYENIDNVYPYSEFLKNSNPIPMINLLKKALKNRIKEKTMNDKIHILQPIQDSTNNEQIVEKMFKYFNELNSKYYEDTSYSLDEMQEDKKQYVIKILENIRNEYKMS